MSRAALHAWLDRYVEASRVPEPEAVEALFTPDATYSTSPFAEVIRGRDAIVGWWTDQPAVPFDAAWDILAVDGEVGIVEATWTYHAIADAPGQLPAHPPGQLPARTYADVWLVRLDGDRCDEFREWFMREPQQAAG